MDGIHTNTITISATEAKTQDTRVDATTNNEPRRAALSLEYEANEGKRRRANTDEEVQRKQQKCDICKQKLQARLVHTHTDQELQANQRQAAPSTERRS